MANQQPSPLPRHLTVTCDECGTCPIVGTRYKSKHIYDYDLCESCMNENGDAEMNNYVALDEPVSQGLANKIGPSHGVQLLAHSFRQAAERIGRNENVEVAHMRIMSDRFHESDGEKLRSALASNTHIQSLHIHMCLRMNRDSLGKVIAEVARGLMSNASVRRVFWCIPQEHRDSSCASALRELIEQNSVIEALFLKRICRSSDVKQSVNPFEDSFAETVFKGLETNSSLKSFRLGGYHVLSERTKQVVLVAVQKNRSISRADAEFEQNDSRLALLLASNRKRWIKRFSDTSASAEKRLRVLLEARDYCHSIDPVAATFHLLRSCPEFLSKPAAKHLVGGSNAFRIRCKEEDCMCPQARCCVVS